MQRYGVTAICGALSLLGAWLLETQQGIEPQVLTAEVATAPAAPEAPPAPETTRSRRDVIAGGIVNHHKGRTVVYACGAEAQVNKAGVFLLDMARGQTCPVYAERWDGPYQVVSDAVMLTEGDDPLVLTMPTVDAGGLGAIMQKRGDGYALTRIRRDGAADRAGLQVGDLLLEVDGEPVDGLSLAQLVDRTVGDSDTLMSLKFRVEGGRISRLLLSRVALDDSEDWID